MTTNQKRPNLITGAKTSDLLRDKVQHCVCQSRDSWWETRGGFTYADQTVTMATTVESNAMLAVIFTRERRPRRRNDRRFRYAEVFWACLDLSWPKHLVSQLIAHCLLVYVGLEAVDFGFHRSDSLQDLLLWWKQTLESVTILGEFDPNVSLMLAH